jgi:hypothetical protein
MSAGLWRGWNGPSDAAAICQTENVSVPPKTAIVLGLILVLSASCSRGAPSPAATTKPATVTAPVKEAQLTSVTLSEAAEKRLAVKTVEVANRAVTRTRALGGEIVAASGAAISIFPPLARPSHGARRWSICCQCNRPIVTPRLTRSRPFEAARLDGTPRC